MGFKNQSVFTTTYTNTTFTVTEGMGIESITINLVSGSATLLGGLQFPGLTLSSVALSVGQPVVLNVNSGYTLTDITVDSTAGGVFQVFTVYAYNNAPDPSAVAYLAATGITGAVQSAAIDTLVKSLKAYNLWFNMKAIYPFVTDNRNLLSYTEDFSGGVWGKSYATITSNTTTAPDGTLTADTLTQSTNDGRVFQTIITTNKEFTASAYVKGNSSSIGKVATIYMWRDGGAEISVQNITLTAEWQRIIFFKTFVTTPSNVTFRLDPIETGVGGDSAYIWGAQLELGLTATTYQPIATTQQAFISNQFKYNLVNPIDSDAAFRLVFNGGWTFSTNGALPNGTNGYADTKLSPLSVLSQNSISGGVYVNSDAPSGNINRTDVLFGASASAATGFSNGFYSLPIASSDSRDYSRANTNLGPGTPSWANGKAFFQIYRTSSTIFTARRNTTTVNHSIGSVAPTANNIWLSGLNAAGVLTEQSSNRIALAYIGNGLTDTEAARLYTIVQAYQTALSRQV